MICSHCVAAAQYYGLLDSEHFAQFLDVSFDPDTRRCRQYTMMSSVDAVVVPPNAHRCGFTAQTAFCSKASVMYSSPTTLDVQRMSGNGGSCMSGEHPSNQSKMSAGLTEHRLPPNERGRPTKLVRTVCTCTGTGM